MHCLSRALYALVSADSLSMSRRSVHQRPQQPPGQSRVVILDKSAHDPEISRWEEDGGAILAAEDAASILLQDGYDLSHAEQSRLQQRRSPLSDRGSYANAYIERYQTVQSAHECPRAKKPRASRRRARNQTRPRAHVLRALRYAG